MTENKDQIATLNTLIATTIDSITGYEDSAANIDNERLRETFRQRANERQKVVEDLRAQVRRLGGEPEDSGSFLGKAHQRFEDLKAAPEGASLASPEPVDKLARLPQENAASSVVPPLPVIAAIDPAEDFAFIPQADAQSAADDLRSAL